MPQYANIYEAKQANELRQCKVKGCTEHRARVSGYCKRHNQTNHLYGSPYHKKLEAKDYAMETVECLGVITKNYNKNHQGVLFGLRFFHQWLTDATEGKPSTPAAAHLRRLSDAGVTPIDLLTTSAAMVLFMNRYPQRIRDGRHLVYCIGNRILRSSRYPGRPRGPLFREVGEHVWNNLKVLLVNIARTIQRKEADAQENLKAMYKELSI